MFIRELGAPGSATTLLLHGMTFSGTVWEPWLPLLQGRCLIADLPGQGQSQSVPVVDFEELAAQLEGELTRRGVTRVSLVGHSLGAYLSLALAIRNRVQVDRMALLSPLAGLDPVDVEKYRQLQVALAGGASLVDVGMSVMYTRDLAQRDHMSYQRAIALLSGSHLGGVIDELKMVVKHFPDYRARLSLIRVPTLVRVGALDVSTSPSVGRDIAASIAGSTFESVENVAHVPHVEDAEGTRDSVLRFLGQHT